MEDKMHLKSETAYFMMLQEGEEARVYLKDDVDAVLAAKDRKIAELKNRVSPDVADANAMTIYYGKTLAEELVYRKADVDAILAKARAKQERELPGPAVAELKDPYFTTCVICDKPWGAGEPHYMHRVAFHGRFVTNLFVCCDCNAKIRRGEI